MDAAPPSVALASLWRDRQFIAVLLAGPAFWGVLWLIEQPQDYGEWPLPSPAGFLLLALVYPVLEELVFRGALQGGLARLCLGRKTLVGITLANLFTSLVFSGLHLLNHPGLWALFVLPPSLVFGYFRDKYQRLWPPIGLHVSYNAGYFSLLGLTTS